MKKLILFLLVCALLGSYAMAENNMGVQVIGGPAQETEPVSLDDFKLETDVEIDGYGILKGLSFLYDGELMYNYNKGRSWNSYRSGQEACFAILNIDIINTMVQAKDYRENCTVKAVYDDTYEYAGWDYQKNYDYKHQDYVLGDEALTFAIEPMYEGHYTFGATLPNAVVNSTKPLRLVITIDGNEITYNIRK